MKILVCGGAGYIGSHMCKMLARHGYEVTVFDNLSTGHREACQWGDFVAGDLLAPQTLQALFATSGFKAVMHFSARSLVGESVANPALYYMNNVVGTLNLLEAMRIHGVKDFVFSSSASTFGNPRQEMIDETHPQIPINPYGETKLIVERALAYYAQAHGLNSVSLRYFNAAGADPEGNIGESHHPETHLIPNVLKAALSEGRRLKLFGNDYPTQDGTCVRDYIHINDLCQAHLLGLKYLADHPGAHGFNLGNGRGFSILDIIRTAAEVTGREIPYDLEARRPGDPASLVADSRKAREVLGWQPRQAEIGDIVRSAWEWHRHQKF
ncbi:MAG: UDP-glucose 4-epimerase GalE [Desulfobulbaceae bacterium]|nr:UDP-glucose 4-epimerase GalE [Desulfobulbaceae bacterium]